MSWFQLDPESIAARVGSDPNRTAIPSLASSVWRGILGFTIVSVLGFVPWAVFGRWFYRAIGEAGLYAVCAVVFIGLSGLLMHRLIIGPGSLRRFYQLFSITFLAYSIAWIVGWMSLRGHPGSLAGLFAGTALMGWMLTRAFDARDLLLKVIAALFVFNTAGYFVGGWIEGSIIPMKEFSLPGVAMDRKTQVIFAKLMWGVCYGVGFGAGLGVAFYLCQSRARALIAAKRGAIEER